MYAIGNSPAYLPVLLGGLGLVFFLPSVIGLIRGVEHLGIVIGLNFIPPLWPAALVGAFMLPRRRPPQSRCRLRGTTKGMATRRTAPTSPGKAPWARAGMFLCHLHGRPTAHADVSTHTPSGKCPRVSFVSPIGTPRLTHPLAEPGWSERSRKSGLACPPSGACNTPSASS